MFYKLTQAINLIKNMGLRYVLFRIYYQIALKSGYFKLKFPSKVKTQNFITLDQWKNLDKKFFFNSREEQDFPKDQNDSLKKEAEEIFNGTFTFFSSIKFNLGKNYDWLTNPENGYKYDINKHWSEINDFSNENGDIKYVWEKSRFSYLYTIIRYDFHFEMDSSKFVFDEILFWIDSNPINMGPNYKCSQETSLRVLNWIFALNFYKKSENLTDSIFQKIISSIYWQIDHVYKNIHFSRIAVRNNHAITETLALFLTGLLMPFFPESNKWLLKGKKWFEKEIEYQVYEDGTYLQFSHNYQRVLVQLLTWSIVLSNNNKEQLDELVIERGKAVLNYFSEIINENNGHLPNYGANDGALFFKLNNDNYRDYRSQLNALSFTLTNKIIFTNNLEDSYWYSNSNDLVECQIQLSRKSSNKYKVGGIYTFRDDQTFTFIKCATYKDRPSQADNLHIDIWYKDENILRDAGSYKYNTKPELQKFFFGTASHNTVMLDDHDQMKKGTRFIWYDWSKVNCVKIEETETSYTFEGEIKAFQHISKDISHKRKIIKSRNKVEWQIIDEINGKNKETVSQVWNPSPIFFDNFLIESYDNDGYEILPLERQGYYSSYYGLKENANQIIFSTSKNLINTIIKLK